MSEYNLGTARGKIEIDASGARKGFQQASGEADTFRGKLDAASGPLKRSGAAMMGAGAAIAAGLGVAIKAAADFEAELSNFKAVTGETEANLELIREKAMQIGRDTSFGAGQAAAAMVELGKAGVSTDDILAGVADSTIALAEAGELDLARAAEITTATMAQFNLTAEDSGKIADLLAGTANAAQGSVEDLGMALRNAGPMAGSLGVSLEDTTTALGILAKNGLTGSKAGTSFMAMLRQLNPQSDKARDSLKELGIITEDGANQFFTAEGKMKSLADVAGILQTATAGLTDEQKQLAITQIFGTEGMAGAVNMMKAGSEGFEEMAASIGSISAADVASEKLNNLSGSMTILKGTIETALIGVGSPLQASLKGIVDGITGLINRFASLSPQVQKFIGIGAIVTSGVLLLGGAFLLLLGFLPAIIAGFTTLFTVVLPIVAPILAVVAVIALLAAGLYLLWTRSETFRDVVMAVWAAIQQAAKAVVDWFVAEALPFLMDTWAQIQTVFQSAMDAVVAIFSWFVGIVQAFWTGFGEHIISAAKNFLGFISEFFRATWENIKQVIEGILRVIKGVFDVFAGIFTGDWQRVWGGIQSIFSGIWSAIHAIFSQIVQTIITVAKVAWETLKTAVGAAMQAISQIFRGIWNAIATFFTAIWNTLFEAARGALQSIKDTILNALNAVYQFWVDSGEKIRSFVSDLWGKIIDRVSEGISDMIQFFKDLPGNILDALGNVGSMLMDAGKKIIQGLVDGVKSMAMAPVNAVKDIAGNMRDMLPFSPARDGPLKDHPPEEAGRTIASMIASGLLAGLDEVNKAGFMLAAETIQQPTGSITPAVNVSVPDGRSGASGGGTFAPSITNNLPGPTSDELTRASERALRSAALKWGVQS